MSWLGIDVGTSAVKSVLVDDRDRVLGEAAAPLVVDRPAPDRAEQDPQSWWDAVAATLDRLAADRPAAMAGVAGIGLSGQMLGVALVDGDGRAIRPALLWNDGRAVAEGRALEAAVADFAGITGSRPMPGFSAPKLRWLATHEPAAIERARHVLLPKDFVRLRLTGEVASDRADASATLLMATEAGDWHGPILAACGVGRAALPRLVDSAEPCGTLLPALARRWGIPVAAPVVGGAGDNMCGALGVGVHRDGAAYASLGTSGVLFVANARFVPSRDRGMHTHRHAVPGLFCQQGVVLSAAAALSWIAGVLGAEVGALVAEVEAARLAPADVPVFTPYLGGERTPHDDPRATAAFSGVTFGTGRLHLVRAVMEGVALAMADCRDALAANGAAVATLAMAGGGARSRLMADLLAAATGCPVTVPRSATIGPALGAARLARGGGAGDALAYAAEPRADLAAHLGGRRARYAAHPRG
ncbi:MAG: xylulokinase [Alphaproteobacteria bacterium]